MFKSIIKSIIPVPLWNKTKEIKFILIWLVNGRPVPFPPIFKRKILEKYARSSGAKIFIETGTYRGETVERLSCFFNKSFSIELYPPLAAAAKEKFKNNPKVTIIQGDSSEILPQILSGINEPIFFWLDSHYSGEGTGKGLQETPIIKEMEIIFSHPIKNHVILIDDARLFNGRGDYPELDKFHEFVNLKNSDLSFEVSNDIIILQKK